MQKMTSKYLPSLDLQTFNYVENSDLFKKCLFNSFKRQVKHIAITVPKAKLLTINSVDLKREKNSLEQPTLFLLFLFENFG